MLGLKIFVQIQTFQRWPFVPSHNFCHPVIVWFPVAKLAHSPFSEEETNISINPLWLAPHCQIRVFFIFWRKQISPSFLKEHIPYLLDNIFYIFREYIQVRWIERVGDPLWLAPHCQISSFVFTCRPASVGHNQNIQSHQRTLKKTKREKHKQTIKGTGYKGIRYKGTSHNQNIQSY